jgi:protein-S-isoprenylcysteine O-methyltransferase Ste14
VNLFKSVLHNLGVLMVGLIFGYLGTRLDALFHFASFRSLVWIAAGCALMAIGFVIRAWATLLFYQRDMRVIVLAPQRSLLTTGPYRFSRNPLYLGGNLFIFLGAVLVLGSPCGIALTALNLVAVDAMVRREERLLAATFGEAWERYRIVTHRWIGWPRARQ